MTLFEIIQLIFALLTNGGSMQCAKVHTIQYFYKTKVSYVIIQINSNTINLEVQ